MPECYAATAERIYPGCRRGREANAAAIVVAASAGLTADVADLVAVDIIRRYPNTKYVRYNEAGDFSADNQAFFRRMTQDLVRNDVTPFAYTKQKRTVWKHIAAAGCVVLVSEQDFVAVATPRDAHKLGLALCPGIGCGTSCLRCPLGLKTAVLFH